MRTLRRLGVGLVLLAAASAVGRAAPSSSDLEKTPQAKAVRAQLEAAAAGDYEAYKRVSTADSLTRMESQIKRAGKTPKEGLQFVVMMVPSDLRFTDLKVDGKTATLSATGKQEGQPVKGTIVLAEEGGQWKAGQQEWGAAK